MRILSTFLFAASVSISSGVHTLPSTVSTTWSKWCAWKSRLTKISLSCQSFHWQALVHNWINFKTVCEDNCWPCTEGFYARGVFDFYVLKKKNNLRPGKLSLSLWNEEVSPPRHSAFRGCTNFHFINNSHFRKAICKANSKYKGTYGHLNRISQFRRYLYSCYSVIWL